MPGSFRHEALRYQGPSAFVPACLSVVQDGLAEDRRLLLLSTGARLTAIREALGRVGDDITFIATDDRGRNPSRITSVLDGFQVVADGRRSVGITDWSLPGRSAAALSEVALADNLLNAVALRGWPLDVVCLYDTDPLAEAGLLELQRAHPFLRGQAENRDYDAGLGARLFAAAFAAGPAGADLVHIGVEGLVPMRRLVQGFATHQGLEADQAADLVLAVNEIATNSVRHGGGSCRVAMWTADRAIVCEVSDTGQLTDPLAGHFAPLPSAASGRGLWLANELCDLVQIRSSAAGTVVRLFMDRL